MAHRQAAQPASSITPAGGPYPETAAMGDGVTPAGGSTSTPTTQPPTRRPCNGTRTRVPIRTSPRHFSGTS